MKAKRIVSLLALGLIVVLAVGPTQAQEPGSTPTPEGPEAAGALGTGFTYQGQLKSGGSPVNGKCDFQFSLWDDASASGGTHQIGSTVPKPGVWVDNGLFTVELDFGGAAFTGSARWLAIDVRCPTGSGSYAMLTPRQALTAAPYALYARTAPWSGLTGMPAGFADGVDTNTTYSAGTGLTLVGTTFSPDTTYLQRRVSGTCADGNAIRVVYADGTVKCQAVGGAGNAWLLSGNAGTAPGTNYLGTSDNQAVELRVNGARALRLEPNATSPNVLGGYSGNSVTAGVAGATIGGGGYSATVNRVTDNYRTVGGGAPKMWRGTAPGAPLTGHLPPSAGGGTTRPAV